MKKRALIMLLAVCIAMSMMPATALAATQTASARRSWDDVELGENETEIRPLEPEQGENYTVAVGAVSNGTVTTDKTSGRAGTMVTVTAAPQAGYVLEEILVDGKAIAGNTFTISGNHTVSAVFVYLYDAATQSLIDFDGKTVETGHTAYVALYNADDRMIAVYEPSYVDSTTVKAVVDSAHYNLAQTVKLMILDETTLAPVDTAVTKVKGEF